ncbi:glycoside hydrolase family 57 protein [Candidatus Woesearchaeota archaeon]|nr:glycoside hydrolase family 57 protein [Candidatus Woesearchaeota archaeon]
MVSICFYFHVHQPHRLGKYGVLDFGEHSNYFDEQKNKEIMHKVTKKCYLPTNKVLLDLIKKHKGKFKISFSITGTVLEQMEKYSPEALESFKELIKTGHVDIVGETYHHSLAYIFSKEEFKEQVKLHEKKIKELFGIKPKVFRNTELIFNNELAKFVQDLGYKAILAEGADHVLNGRTPNHVYKSVFADKIKLLLKNYKLSDDIAFRFSNKEWNEHPLTVDKYSRWINEINGGGELVNLFMDYETFGEHQWEDTGIFEFMKHLPEELLKHPHNEFLTVTEAAEKYPIRDTIDVHNYVSWADIERDLTAWLGNPLQDSAMQALYKIEKHVKETKDEELIRDWRNLTTSDHVYYMCTKWFNDGDVHKYFSPYDSPYDAYIIFMTVLNDFVRRIHQKQQKQKDTTFTYEIRENPELLLETKTN